MLGLIEMVECVAVRTDLLTVHCRHVQSCSIRADMTSAFVLIGHSWLCCSASRAPVCLTVACALAS